MRTSYRTEDYDFTSFKSSHLTTKEGLQKSVVRRIERYKQEANKDNMHSAAFYYVLLTLLERFRENVETTRLLDYLPDWWIYTYDVNHSGAALTLEHVSEVTVDENNDWCSWVSDSRFLLVEVKTKLLTVEQFSQMHGVEQVTVRQWIRRGKLRTAIKQGNEWRIPSLTDLRPRGYETAQYTWRGPLPDLPEEYEYINNYCLATFIQDRENKTLYKILFVPVDDTKTNITNRHKPYELLCTNKEKEKLEMLMISHPLIQYVDSY